MRYVWVMCNCSLNTVTTYELCKLLCYCAKIARSLVHSSSPRHMHCKSREAQTFNNFAQASRNLSKHHATSANICEKSTNQIAPKQLNYTMPCTFSLTQHTLNHGNSVQMQSWILTSMTSFLSHSPEVAQAFLIWIYHQLAVCHGLAAHNS
jgi:hypothetical protein